MDWLKKIGGFIMGSQVAQVVLGLLGAFFAFKTVQWKARMDGEEIQRKKQQVETAKEREVVLGTSHQVIEDIEDAKDRAAAAPSTVPVVSGPEQLRKQAPAIAKVILRDRG